MSQFTIHSIQTANASSGDPNYNNRAVADVLSRVAQIAQALALMGAAPRFDCYGRLAGAEPVAEHADQEAAEANRRLVEKNRYPDVTLGIAPIQRGGSIDSWEAMVEVNIPIRFDTRRSQESEAAAMLAAAKERQQAITNQVTGELQENLAALNAAWRQDRLIADTLLPQAELTFQSALAGYEQGKVDFATLLDAQRSIKRARQDKLKVQVEQELRLTDIEKLVGEEI